MNDATNHEVYVRWVNSESKLCQLESVKTGLSSTHMVPVDLLEEMHKAVGDGKFWVELCMADRPMVMALWRGTQCGSIAELFGEME